MIMANKKGVIYLEGPSGRLAINSNDNLCKKIAMLIENKCLGVTASDAAKKYGYSRTRFYQLKDDFERGGTEALRGKKKGPKRKYVRTETINNQIIRYKFLDPKISASVITQKMRQLGYKISIRSVERTITELGLQKKTLFFKSEKK